MNSTEYSVVLQAVYEVWVTGEEFIPALSEVVMASLTLSEVMSTGNLYQKRYAGKKLQT